MAGLKGRVGVLDCCLLGWQGFVQLFLLPSPLESSAAVDALPNLCPRWEHGEWWSKGDLKSQDLVHKPGITLS